MDWLFTVSGIVPMVIVNGPFSITPGPLVASGVGDGVLVLLRLPLVGAGVGELLLSGVGVVVPGVVLV